MPFNFGEETHEMVEEEAIVERETGIVTVNASVWLSCEAVEMTI